MRNPLTERDHKLRPVAVFHEVYRHGTETRVLHRCDCGCDRRKVETLPGAWTLEQITGSAE